MQAALVFTLFISLFHQPNSISDSLSIRLAPSLKELGFTLESGNTEFGSNWSGSPGTSYLDVLSLLEKEQDVLGIRHHMIGLSCRQELPFHCTIILNDRETRDIYDVIFKVHLIENKSSLIISNLSKSKKQIDLKEFTAETLYPPILLSECHTSKFTISKPNAQNSPSPVIIKAEMGLITSLSTADIMSELSELLANNFWNRSAKTNQKDHFYFSKKEYQGFHWDLEVQIEVVEPIDHPNIFDPNLFFQEEKKTVLLPSGDQITVFPTKIKENETPIKLTLTIQERKKPNQ